MEKSIHDVIKERRRLPEEEKKFIKSNIFFNIMMAIIIFVCTLIINITYSKFSLDAFKKYINVFQIVLAVITIVLFETAYKKDSFLISFYGIESFVFSIAIMFVPYFYILKKEYNALIIIVSLMAVYYIFKSIIIALYIRNNYIKNNISDVKEILKEEKKSYIDEESTKTLKEKSLKNNEKNVTKKAVKEDLESHKINTKKSSSAEIVTSKNTIKNLSAKTSSKNITKKNNTITDVKEEKIQNKLDESINKLKKVQKNNKLFDKKEDKE